MPSFIWTNHALDRLNERNIPKNFVENALYSPDSVNEKNGSLNYVKKMGEQTVTAIIKRNERNENIVVSFWVDPPFIGTKDYKKKQRWQQMKRGSFIKKFWLTLLNQIGL